MGYSDMNLECFRPATLLKKEILAQVFPCEFCEISKNTFFTEHLRWLLLEKCLFCNVTEKSYFSFLLFFFLPQFSGRKKQPFTDVLHNRCSQKFCNIPVLESLFNTVANLLACSFKYPSTEFFLVLIFPHSDQKKLRIWILFTQCLLHLFHRISLDDCLLLVVKPKGKLQ